MRKHDCAALEKLFRRTISRNVWSWSRSIDSFTGPLRDIFKFSGFAHLPDAHILLSALLIAASSWLQDGHNVLLVVNDDSRFPGTSATIMHAAGPFQQPISAISGPREDENDFARRFTICEIAGPIARFLTKRRIGGAVLYIVTTLGVPLRDYGTARRWMTDGAAVDSELTLLYMDHEAAGPHALRGSIPNPFFGKKDAPFTHPQFPIYLVTRLAAYDFDGVKAIIDRSLKAANKGKFVIDEARAGEERRPTSGCTSAAIFCRRNAWSLDATTTVLYGLTDVIGYASWGSNDTEPAPAVSRIPLAAGRDRDRVRLDQRAHVQEAAGIVDHLGRTGTRPADCSREVRRR